MLDSWFQGVSRRSWHARYMFWIWGFKSYDFTLGCTYWWLSTLNVLFFWLIIPIKYAVKFLAWSFKSLDNWMTKLEDDWQKEYYQKLKDNPQEMEFFSRIDFNRLYSDKNKYTKFYWNYWINLADTDEYDKFIVSNRENVNKVDEIRTTKIKNNKQKIGKMVNIIKPIMQLIGLALGAAVLYLIGYGIWYAWTHTGTVNWQKVLDVTLKILVFIGVILSIVVVWVIFEKFVHIKLETKKKIQNIVCWPFIKIGKFFKYMWAVMASFKNANCPLMTWKD